MADGYLIDTQILLWSILDERQKLSPAVLRILRRQEDLYLSIASLWEITIKLRTGKLQLEGHGVEDIFDYADQTGIKILPILRSHLAALETLPSLHRDPFDRLIIAQAKAEGLQLISTDRIIWQYEPRTIR